MIAKEIYEKVLFKYPLEERIFLNYLSDSITELQTIVGNGIYKDDMKLYKIISLNDELPILDIYCPPIVDNILYLCGFDTNGSYKSEFLRKASLAKDSVWKEKNKGRKILKRTGW